MTPSISMGGEKPVVAHQRRTMQRFKQDRPDEGSRGTRSRNMRHFPRPRRGPGSACRVDGFGAPPVVPWQAVGQFDRLRPCSGARRDGVRPPRELGGEHDEHIVWPPGKSRWKEQLVWLTGREIRATCLKCVTSSPPCSFNPPSPLSNRNAARRSQRFTSRRLNRLFRPKKGIFMSFNKLNAFDAPTVLHHAVNLQRKKKSKATDRKIDQLFLR